MLTTAEQLRNALLDRARAFETQIEAELGHLNSGGPGVAHALQLFLAYAKGVADQVTANWDDSLRDDFRIANLGSLNDHLRERIEFFDGNFRRGQSGIPHAVSSAIEAECFAMGLKDREAAITLGPPTNFGTFVGDLNTYLFGLFNLEIQAGLPQALVNRQLVMISVPDTEGSRAAWLPIVVGHELAHLLQRQRSIDLSFSLSKTLDRPKLMNSTGRLPTPVGHGAPRVRVIEQVAARWLNEIICDAFAIHRFGAGGLAGLTDFLYFVNSGFRPESTHPPKSLRTALMFKWLPEELSPVDEEIVSPFRDLAGQEQLPDWADHLSEVFLSLAAYVFSDVQRWTAQAHYHEQNRHEIVSALSGSFDRGIPGSAALLSSAPDGLNNADVVNAVWLSMQRESDKPINRLGLKALDTLDFITKWRDAGGDDNVVDELGDQSAVGVLTEHELNRRLESEAADELAVTPLLRNAVNGASMDLRLGNKFIIFERSSAAMFDALNEAQDPRSMQSFVQKAWGDVFYLHPGQLVLAATLEYISMPGDLSAQVITRSSYGRLGLLSATAVQVHPYFTGCLTLELVNLGEMPMAITPGERVAQLMFFTTTGAPTVPAQADNKYRYPTGPEFSKIRNDTESKVLRKLRDSFDKKQKQ